MKEIDMNISEKEVKDASCYSKFDKLILVYLGLSSLSIVAVFYWVLYC